MLSRHIGPAISGVPGRGGLRHQLRRPPDPHQPLRARGPARQGAVGPVPLRPHPRGGGQQGDHTHDCQVN